MLGFKGFLAEAQMDKTQLLKRDNINILKTAIEKGTPLETSKGKTSLTFINDVDKVAFNSGDLDTAFYNNRRFKKVFRTDDGEEITLKDVVKTDMFGGGKGSGGGAANTKVTESLQCVYCSEIFNGVKPDDIDLKGLKFKDFEVDESIENIDNALTDDWIHSSVMIANLMKSKMKGKYVFHRGSPFVSEIENKFKVLNKDAGRPFSNINKWSPADIWAVRKGFVPNLNKYDTLGEFNNYFKEVYDSGDLLGISLKKVSGSSVPYGEYNVTGFIRRPVTFGGYQVSGRTFFSGKDCYVTLKGAGNLQLRTFGNFAFQGEIKGRSAAAGKIGGGIILGILEKVTSKQTKYTQARVKGFSNPRRINPQFLQEFYEMYIGLEEKTKILKLDEFKKQLEKQTHDYIFSKYWGMFVVSEIVNSGKSNDVTDAIAGYAASQSDLSGPYAKYGD